MHVMHFIFSTFYMMTKLVHFQNDTFLKGSCQEAFCCLQVQGRWQRRSQLLRDLFDRACDAEAEFHEFQIGHIYR